tara:strand:+ start:99 stop:392 length:294 start_codon:yes stop_codon:yes gene_type:complete
MDLSVLQIVGQIFGTLVTILSGVWWLSTRLERMSAQLESHSKLMEQKFSALDKEMGDFRRSLDDAREGRVEIWKEVNSLRERLAGAEARTCGKGATK